MNATSLVSPAKISLRKIRSSVPSLPCSGNMGQFVPRCVRDEQEPAIILDSSFVVARYWREKVEGCSWYNPAMEHVAVFVMGQQLDLRGWSLVAMGSADGQIVALRDVLRAVLVAGGVGFIIAHNHTSYSAEPSAHDVTITGRIAEAARVVGLRLHDHVIVAANSHFSFVDEGRMPL